MTERSTVQELASKYDLHPGQISNWKNQFKKNAPTVFDKPVKSAHTEAQEKEELYLKVIVNRKSRLFF